MTMVIITIIIIVDENLNVITHNHYLKKKR
jgi:hypothetical protein